MEAVVQQHSSGAGEGPEEVGRLREEVETLRGELQRAEVELEDRCWVAPTVLQHWLQMTYELESLSYNCKKKAAEEQMEAAKDACERLKRKRSSFVGAFVSTHGRSIDEVDRSILEAKTALLELTQDLGERSTRWRQIEMLTGVTIVNNPGLSSLQRLVRHVGGGAARSMQRGPSSHSGSRLSSCLSMEELGDDFDSRSLAPSMTASLAPSLSSLRSRQHQTGTQSSSQSVASFSLGQTDRPLRRQTGLQGSLASSRESSKESNSTDSQEELPETPCLPRERLSVGETGGETVEVKSP